MNYLWKRPSRFQWNGDNKLSKDGHALFIPGYPDPIQVPGASLIPLAIGSNPNDSKDKNCTSLVEEGLGRGALATLGSDGTRDVRIEHSGSIVLRHLNPHVQQQSSLHLVSIPQWNMTANTTTAIFTLPMDSSDMSIVLEREPDKSYRYGSEVEEKLPVVIARNVAAVRLEIHQTDDLVDLGEIFAPRKRDLMEGEDRRKKRQKRS